MKRTKWQQKQYTKAHNLLRTVLEEATNALTKTELYQQTGLSRATIDRHLNHLLNSGEVVKIEKKYILAKVYKIVAKGLKADEQLLENLETTIEKLKILIGQLSLPTNIFKLKEKGNIPLPDAVFERGYITGEELQDLFDQQQKVFGGLRQSFFELAKILMKADAAIITAKDDLSNVQITFHDGQPGWLVLPDTSAYKNDFFK